MCVCVLYAARRHIYIEYISECLVVLLQLIFWYSISYSHTRFFPFLLLRQRKKKKRTKEEVEGRRDLARFHGTTKSLASENIKWRDYFFYYNSDWPPPPPLLLFSPSVSPLFPTRLSTTFFSAKMFFFSCSRSCSSCIAELVVVVVVLCVCVCMCVRVYVGRLYCLSVRPPVCQFSSPLFALPLVLPCLTSSLAGWRPPTILSGSSRPHTHTRTDRHSQQLDSKTNHISRARIRRI